MPFSYSAAAVLVELVAFFVGGFGGGGGGVNCSDVLLGMLLVRCCISFSLKYFKIFLCTFSFW